MNKSTRSSEKKAATQSGGKRPARPKKMTMLEQELWPHRNDLQNVHPATAPILLAIDPSTGSQSSMPGWAIYRAGELQASGIIQVDPATSKNLRLWQIASAVRELANKYVVTYLAIEWIPPRRFRGGAGLNAASLTALQRAVGAVYAAWHFTAVFEVPPTTWGRFLGSLREYKKSDEWDAIAIGNACYCVVNELVSGSGRVPRKATTAVTAAAAAAAKKPSKSNKRRVTNATKTKRRAVKRDKHKARKCT